ETSRPRRTLALDHPPTFGTMAAVAAASAELLIIGWYIFRVLLQGSYHTRIQIPEHSQGRARRQRGRQYRALGKSHSHKLEWNACISKRTSKKGSLTLIPLEITARHSVPSAALECHSPQTGEGTGVQTRRKVGGSEKHTGPVADGHPITPDTKESVRGPLLLSPHTPSDKGGGRKRKKKGGGRETEVARKECPASQKLSPSPRSGTEEVVVAPAPPSPVPGAR
ncbi:neuronatin, isoform CRA_d, partial [Mus musculus]